MIELACIEYASNVSSERVSECSWETTAASAVPSSRSCPCGRGWSGTAKTLSQSPSDRERRSTTTPSELKCMPERGPGQLSTPIGDGASCPLLPPALHLAPLGYRTRNTTNAKWADWGWRELSPSSASFASGSPWLQDAKHEKRGSILVKG